MSATKRAQLINKLFKVAKKHFAPIPIVSSRSVLEHLLYACCLENSHNDVADEAFAKLEQHFFDWNEVRVTTTSEISESMKGLTHPDAAATTVKKALHGVFETYYEFDIEFLKKENLRKTVQQFTRFRGVSPFVVSYTAQVALDGHFIPLDRAMLNLMVVLGVVTEDEVAKGRVPGLERTIAKNKGVEFSSVVHQLAAAFHKSPFGKDARAIILSIAPTAKDRFPKRGGRAKVAEPESKTSAKTTVKSSAKTTKTKAAKKPVLRESKKPAKKTATKKVVVKKVATQKAKPTQKKKTVAKKSTKRTTTKKTAKKSIVEKAARTGKKSTTKSLSRKKPR